MLNGEPGTAASAPLETENPDTLLDPWFVTSKKLPDELIAMALGLVPVAKGDPVTSVEIAPLLSEKARTEFVAGLVTYKNLTWGSTTIKVGEDPTVKAAPGDKVPVDPIVAIPIWPVVGLDTYKNRESGDTVNSAPGKPAPMFREPSATSVLLGRSTENSAILLEP